MVAGVVALLAASQIAFAANGAPSTYGDIYRVDPSGAITNLTHDPAVESFPSASPNGKLVAFLRQRAASVQVDVVGSDGRGLRAVSPRLPGGGLHDGATASITWAPDDRRFAVELSRGASASTLYLTSAGGGWRAVDRGLGQAPPAWSANGRLVAVTSTAGLVDVVDAARGRRVWRAVGEGTSAWSSTGLLAVHRDSTTTALYDAGGHEVAQFAGDGFAWSGSRLASLRNGVLELRRNGVGAPSVHVRLVPKSVGYDSRVVWVGANQVDVVGSAETW